MLYVSVRSWSGCYMCHAWLCVCVCGVYVVCVSGMDVTGMGIMCVTVVCVWGGGGGGLLCKFMVWVLPVSRLCMGGVCVMVMCTCDMCCGVFKLQ